VPEYRERPDGSIKQGSGGDHYDNAEWQLETARLHDEALDLYERMIADDVAPEQARGVLPQNMMTSWVWTGTLTSFFHMCRLRLDSHAQVEAQEFAALVEGIISDLFPVSWKALWTE
jgi:thymidylate synthase (FAD)